jgi:CheY-like chemotaxis protein
MSHEMRTPLNGLLGSLELLEQGDLDAVQRRHLATLRLSGELLLHHVNDVLDISRLDAAAHSFALEPIDPAAILRDLAESQAAVAAAAGNVIEVVLPEADRITLLGDPRRLRQALLNLLGNALKFTRSGRITLAFTTGAENEDGLAVEFRVSDTGIGIAAEDQSRIFEDFVTLDASYGRAAEGTGLGLPITRRLVTAMGGCIGVESAPGAGSSFWIRLSLPVDRGRTEPTPPAAALPPAAPATAAGPSGRPCHVLMVEDNEVNRAILRAFLGKLGHEVEEAHDGEEGVRLAELRRYDLIFMDISMPRLSGVEATRLIRAGDGVSRDAPIVAVTAHALPAELAAFRAAGIDAVLTKPIRLKAISEAIEAHRAGRPAAAESASGAGAREGDREQGPERRDDGPAGEEARHAPHEGMRADEGPSERAEEGRLEDDRHGEGADEEDPVQRNRTHLHAGPSEAAADPVEPVDPAEEGEPGEKRGEDAGHVGHASPPGARQAAAAARATRPA